MCKFVCSNLHNMRQQISISRASRGVWAEARVAAHDDDTTISDLTATALREYLERRAKRLAKGVATR